LSKPWRHDAKPEDFVPGEWYVDYSHATVNTLPLVVQFVERGESGWFEFEKPDGERYSTWRFKYIYPINHRQVIVGLRSRRKHTERRIEKWTSHIDDIDDLIASVESLQKGGDD
jgi:hypothetical protein